MEDKNTQEWHPKTLEIQIFSYVARGPGNPNIFVCALQPLWQWRSQTKMVTKANQFILLMIGAIRME